MLTHILWILTLISCGKKTSSQSSSVITTQPATMENNSTDSQQNIAQDLGTSSMQAQAQIPSESSSPVQNSSTENSNSVPQFGRDPRFPQPYTMAANYDFQESQESFTICPGNSFLIGHEASYDLNKGDRRFVGVCDSFMDSKGNFLIRKDCQISSPGNDPTTNMTLSCPEEFILSGFKTQWLSSDKDRIWLAYCCKYENSDQIPIAWQKDSYGELSCEPPLPFTPSEDNPMLPKKGVTRQVNLLKNMLKFSCSPNKALRTLYSSYDAGDGFNYGKNHPDRRFSYDCCDIYEQLS